VRAILAFGCTLVSLVAIALQHLANPNNSKRVAYFKYPLPEFACVYTPSAMVFRGEHDDGYPFLPAPRRMAFVAAAAYNRPDVRGDLKLCACEVLNV
jgi:hypothetical protein